MPLQPQLVRVQMGAGINTKPDPKQLPSGQLLTLQNGQFSKTGQLNKRFGYNLLSNQIEGGAFITSGVELASYLNELILFDGNYIFSYLPSTGHWSNRGTAISVTTLDADVIRKSNAQQLNPDMAYASGAQVFAWEDSRGGVRYSVRDASSGAFTVADAVLDAAGAQPKCVTYQGFVYVFVVVSSATLKAYQINPLNSTQAPASFTFATDGYGASDGYVTPYDVSVIGANIWVAYLSSSVASGAINLFSINSLLIKSAVTQVATGSNAITAGFAGAVNVVGTDLASNVWVSWSTGAAVNTAAYATSNVASVLALTQVEAVNGVVITGIAAPTASTLLLSYEVAESPAYNEQTHYTTITTVGAVGSIRTIRSVGLASKAYSFNGNTYINCAYSSTLQATDFLILIAQQGIVLTTPVIVGKCTPSIAGGLLTNNMCPETVMLMSGVFIFANLIAGKILSEANTLFTLLGVNSTTLTFTPSDNFVTTTQSKTLLIVGGILQGYDGATTTELGFHLYPENISLSTTGSGSGLSTGSYQYAVTYEWMDNQGQIYRSAPSVAATIQVTAGQKVAVVVPTLRLTAKTNVSIVIYRTQANGTIFNRVTSSLAPTLNNPAVDTVTFTDSLSDLNANSNDLLYTTGGVLNNIAPPANSIICTYLDRVFLAGMSDRLLMWYSQTVANNSNANTIPPQFCAELTTSLDPRGGNVTALGVLNQTLIIFKHDSIFALQGNGPDATGNNNDYGEPQMITSDVGCINDLSVVIVPHGLMFQSSKGIYLLDQSLNVTYIGAPVEAYNANTITSATLHTQYNQVIFTTSQGTALVYDYYMEQWSTWTNHVAADAVMYQGTYYWLNSNGKVFQQNTTSFTDAGSPILMSFTLPNLAFAGLQGYQRVFRMYILGTYKGPHTLNVQVAFDYNDTYTQFATIQPSPANLSTWGSDISWGDGQFWGGVGGNTQLYEYRVDMAIQKCTAIRIFISDNQASQYNEGYAISNIAFLVGVLPGGTRLPASKTYGAK